MKCHVPGHNVKVLGRTVHALARFGDELYLESQPDCLLLRTLNAAESAYAMIKFNKKFFSYFNYNYYSTEDSEGLKCKISMKSALNTFRSPAHMDKQVENLEIKLDTESCKLIFQLKCKHEIVKTHFVSILDCKALQAIYTKDLVPNRISTLQRILLNALRNFQNSGDQVTIEATRDKFLLRNYVDNNTDDRKIIHTQVSLNSTEFDNYTIGEETTITFSLKEFRALLVFAEALNLPLQLHFELTGQPAVFIVHNGSLFEAHFVLATSKPDTATQVSSTQNTVQSERIKRKENNKNNTQGSIRKKPHIEKTEVNKCLDEDSHLFNFIEIPNENLVSNCQNMDIDNIGNNLDEIVDKDNIPGSPTSSIMINSIFKRCFENTFDPRTFHRPILAANSDSE